MKINCLRYKSIVSLILLWLLISAQAFSQETIYSGTFGEQILKIGENKGQLVLEWVMTPLVNIFRGSLGFADSSIEVKDNIPVQRHYNLELLFHNRSIYVRDGLDLRHDIQITTEMQKQYYFRMEVDLPAMEYSVFVVPAGEDREYAIAKNYSFRSIAKPIDDLGTFFVVTGGCEKDFRIDSLTVTPAHQYKAELSKIKIAGLKTNLDDKSYHVPVNAEIPTPWLSVNGNWIVDPAGNKVVLRGVSIAALNAGTKWLNGGCVTCEGGVWSLLDKIVRIHGRVVRLPIDSWFNMTDEFFYNTLLPVIDYCERIGLYAIVDWHLVGELNDDVKSRVMAFWDYVVPRLADRSNVLFEIVNEPSESYQWSYWQEWAQPIVDLVRSHAPNNLILIGGPAYSSSAAGALKQPFIGKNLVYVVHIYAQHFPNRDKAFGDFWDKLPLVVGEWGYRENDEAQAGTRGNYGDAFRAYLDARPSVGWLTWCFDNTYRPVMLDSDWEIIPGDAYAGDLTTEWLGSMKDKYNPEE
ncbi:MAG: cellulase family glycosylhydrolase [Spirochaetales bacterium]|nr:cellulase family glycosylhydrolase [Spirochaetales bacterium]